MVQLISATVLLAPIHVINAGSLTFLKATKHHAVRQEHRGEEYMHRGDCWAHRPVHRRFARNQHSFTQQTPHSLQEPQLALPGAGMHPEDIEPFQTVTKDGFLLTACVKDAMLEHGDKFGNNKFKYKYGTVSNTSIVHYQEIIPKEDREKMTIDRCFDFCRTVPNMVYFGLHMGRDCYCTPFYKPMAGDSSNCDQVCEGEPSQMCGGKTLSSIFEMHTCANTQGELEDAITDVENKVFFHFQDLADRLNEVAEAGKEDSEILQEVFGAAGAPDVSNYMQHAKVYVGVLLDAVDKAHKLIDDLQDPYDAAQVSLGRNLQNFENIKVAEDAIRDLKAGIAESAKQTDSLKELRQKVHPASLMGTEGYNATDASAQYYPIMYFSSDDYRNKTVMLKEHMWHAPATCTGDLLQIIFGGVADDCANACDGLVGKCIGFNYFALNDGMCFLLETLETVQHWSGCNREDNPAPFASMCYGKLSKLEGVGGIAPREDKILEEARGTRQGTGKCAHCLDELIVSDRCYEYGIKCRANEKQWHSWMGGCEELATYYPSYCDWEWGREGYYYGDGGYYGGNYVIEDYVGGAWFPAQQVCPHCGTCISNGRGIDHPEEWPPYMYYYYTRNTIGNDHYEERWGM